MPDEYRNQDPWRDQKKSEKRYRKKTPLMQPTREDSQALNTANTGSRKHAVYCGSLFFHPPVAAEGRFKSYFANSSRK